MTLCQVFEYFYPLFNLSDNNSNLQIHPAKLFSVVRIFFPKPYNSKCKLNSQRNSNFSINFHSTVAIDDFTPPTTTNSTEKSQKFVKKFINEGISNFFIGSYITFIIILQAVIFILLSVYLIKITKYEKLDGDVNYANTILNDDEIYKVYKSHE
jgi:hypothetical protein